MVVSKYPKSNLLQIEQVYGAFLMTEMTLKVKLIESMKVHVKSHHHQEGNRCAMTMTLIERVIVKKEEEGDINNNIMMNLVTTKDRIKGVLRKRSQVIGILMWLLLPLLM